MIFSLSLQPPSLPACRRLLFDSFVARGKGTTKEIGDVCTQATYQCELVDRNVVINNYATIARQTTTGDQAVE